MSKQRPRKSWGARLMTMAGASCVGAGIAAIADQVVKAL